ncbi:hypothetical protein D3C75_927990 [compost metagenome]
MVPCLVERLDAAQNIDVTPKLIGFTLAQLAQFPIVASGLLSTALDDALLGKGGVCSASPLKTVELISRCKQFST